MRLRSSVVSSQRWNGYGHMIGNRYERFAKVYERFQKNTSGSYAYTRGLRGYTSGSKEIRAVRELIREVRQHIRSLPPAFPRSLFQHIIRARRLISSSFQYIQALRYNYLRLIGYFYIIDMLSGLLQACLQSINAPKNTKNRRYKTLRLVYFSFAVFHYKGK